MVSRVGFGYFGTHLGEHDGNDQHMTFRTNPMNNQGTQFIFTTVYASPQCTVRKSLWLQLKKFKTTNITNREPWLLMGDFNVILGPHKKQGGWQENNRYTGGELQDFLDSS